MGVTQPWNVLGCTATCGALDLPSSLGSSSPFATPGALSACSSVGEKLLISELGEETGRPQGDPPLWDDSEEVCVAEH